MSSDAGEGTQNGGVIAAASLSIVSILGFVGTVLMNHKDIILEKMKCWVGWGAQPTEDERVTDLEARPSTAVALPTCITLPITINNHSGEMTLTANPHRRSHHNRSQSDPTYETSDSYHETSSSGDHLSSSSSDMIARRVSLDIV